MEKTIYVKLLEDGTLVYRPVPAIEVEKNVYEVKGQSIYDSHDEVWEFKPGIHVIVKEQKLGGSFVLVAISERL